MRLQLTCPHGHRWETGATEESETEANRYFCPQCAAEGTPGVPGVPADGPMQLPPLPRALPERVAAFSAGSAFVGGLPQIAGHALLEKLGQGGMGVVYKARQLKLDRIVALKMVLAGRAAAPEELTRFRIEAEAAAQLQHPNIAQIFEVGEQDGCPYFTLEYVDGGNLAQRLSGKPQPPEEAARLVQCLAGAVHSAHQRNIIHRDLKPANILLTADGTPKIVDFGLAKRLDHATAHTRSGDVLGTPSYMAPEQISGDRHTIGPGADVYALGTILYEMLTGRPPFQGVNLPETLQQVLTAEPVSPRRLQPHVPRDLETVCLKCLEKERARRYAGAAELAEDLRRYLAGEPLRVRPAGPVERAWKWARRRPAVASLLALGAAAMVVSAVAVVALWYNAQLQQANREAVSARNEAELARQAEEQQRQAAELARDDAQKAHRAEAAARQGEEGQRRRAEDALARLRHVDYYHRIGNSERELLANNVAHAEELLGDEAERSTAFRGWEWHYLKRQCHPELLALRRDDVPVANDEMSVDQRLQLPVTSVGFSPDGSLLACASQDRTVTVWNARTGKPLHVLRHRLPILSMAVSADGQWIASGAGSLTGTRVGGAIDLWNVGKRELTRSLGPHEGRVWCLVFSPDSRLLASAGEDKTVRLWDVASGKETTVFRGHNGPVMCVAFRPDGKQMASTASGVVKIWDPTTAAEISSLGQAYRDRILSLAYSPDGQRIAWAGASGEVRMAQIATGKIEVFRGRHSLFAYSVAFRPDGKQLASAGGDQTVKIWDAATGEELRVLRGHTALIRCVAYSADGRRLASGADDGSAKIWEAQPAADFSALRGENTYIESQAFSADGTAVAMVVGRGGAVRVCDTLTGRILCTLNASAPRNGGVALSPDGRRVAAAVEETAGAVKVWEVGSGRPIAQLQGHTAPVQSLAFSPDGQRLASACAALGVRLWNAQSGQPISVVCPPATQVARGPVALAFSPDGRRLAAILVGRVRVYDLAAAQTIHDWQQPRSRHLCVAFSPDGQIIAMGNQDRSIRVLEVAGGRPILSLKGHANPVTGVAFSPDGKRLVSASPDRTVKLWDTTLGQEILTLRGHNSQVQAVTFTLDGGRILSTSRDGSVKRWDGTPIR